MPRQASKYKPVKKAATPRPAKRSDDNYLIEALNGIDHIANALDDIAIILGKISDVAYQFQQRLPPVAAAGDLASQSFMSGNWHRRSGGGMQQDAEAPTATGEPDDDDTAGSL
jgi:hypothetical protein